jgi:hypothetical protein
MTAFSDFKAYVHTERKAIGLVFWAEEQEAGKVEIRTMSSWVGMLGN